MVTGAEVAKSKGCIFANAKADYVNKLQICQH